MTRSSDVERTRREGSRIRTEHLEARAASSLFLHPRLAVIVGKHGHSIVERNKLRRQLREIFRVKVLPLVDGMDVLVRAFPTAYSASFGDLTSEALQIGKGLNSEQDNG